MTHPNEHIAKLQKIIPLADDWYPKDKIELDMTIGMAILMIRVLDVPIKNHFAIMPINEPIKHISYKWPEESK